MKQAPAIPSWKEYIWTHYQKHLLVAIFSMLIILVMVPIGTYLYFAQDLTTKQSVMNRNDGGVILQDMTGKTFFTFYQAKYKTFVPLSEIPQSLQHAVIAAEDRDFYSHPGFSVKGILRSVFFDIKSRGLGYGGSTITQQLVKNALLKPTKSFLRKYQEVILANELERRYSKSEILEMYLNSVYFGSGAFGAEEASQVYFNKPAKNLTLAESALLAGILPAPSALSPFDGDFEKAKTRENLVLAAMQEEKYITATEKATAEKQEIKLSTVRDELNAHAPHFAIAVLHELTDTYGEETIIRSGFTVKTTLDLAWQEYAEQTVKDQVALLKPNNVSNGAVVVIDPKTGAVRTMVGSKGWENNEFGKFNVAISERQPGSSFKPIVYSYAFQNHIITPSTMLHDMPTTFPGGYKPVNYDRKTRGLVTPRRALANSLNIPAVEVLNKVGVSNAIEWAKRLGITTIENDLSRYGLALTLGGAEVTPLEMTAVYATFANGGVHNTPYLIEEVRNKSNEIVLKHTTDPEPVMEPGVAFIISSILSDNAARQEAFGNTLTISRAAAVKTGTTDDYKDAWTLGYTPSVAIGVWVGNNDGAPMDRIAGSLGAAPIWKSLMEHFLAGTPVESFTPSSDVMRTNLCPPKEASASASMDYFLRGTEPQSTCPPTPTPSISTTPSPSPTSVSITSTPTPSQAATPTPGSPTPTPIVTLQVPPGQEKKKDN